MSQTSWSASPGCGFQAHQRQIFPGYGYLLSAAALPALRRPRRSQPLCVGLPGNGHRLQPGDGHRQPDLHPLFRLPLLHGCLPLPRPVFQLVGSGLARRHGKVPEPQCVPAHARHVVEKCSFCFHRYQLAKQGLSTRDGGCRSGLPDRLHPGLSGRRHRFRRPEQSGARVHQIVKPDPKTATSPKIPGHSGCWSDWAPTPRYTTCPPGMGSAGRRQLPRP
jgi:hypothetical protein